MQKLSRSSFAKSTIPLKREGSAFLLKPIRKFPFTPCVQHSCQIQLIPIPSSAKGQEKINLCSIRNTSLKQTKIRISCSPFLAGFFPIPFHKKKGFRRFLYKPASGSFLRCPDTLLIKPSPKAILTPLLCKDSSKIKQPKPNSFPPVKFSRLPPKQTIRIDCPTACSLSIQAAPALKAHLPIHPTIPFLHPSP